MAKSVVVTASLEYERHFYANGYRLIAGLDEAGRGAWAGPVAAAAVVLPLDREDLSEVLAGVTDSKALKSEERDKLVPLIKEVALAWSVGRVTSEEIDKQGIVQATKTAMQRALNKLAVVPDFLLIDALALPEAIMAADKQSSLIKGDEKSLSIAAASILAKVTRDQHMIGLDEMYPEYGFAQHKGYGTRVHRSNLGQHGPCRAHRHSFKPIMTWQQLF